MSSVLKLLMLFSLFIASASADNLPDFSEMVRASGNAVVNISTVQNSTTPDKPAAPLVFKTSRSLGSGFVISNDGYILTNRHVIQNADEIRVKFKDHRELVATMIGSDAATDIALLKVPASDLNPVQLGQPEQLRVGEWVVAIGSPFGFDQSVTAGIVSAKDRSVSPETYVGFIQTDVAINPGNSGGPLFNLDGKVIGINSWIFSQTGGYMGLSFAIPIDVVMNVVNQIKTKGKVSRGWIGVQTQEVSSDLAKSFIMERPHGALISEVAKGSPADLGGVIVGDVVVAINGRTIETAGELPPKIGMMQVGEKVVLEIVRQGQKKTISLNAALLPETKPNNNSEVNIKIVNRLGLVIGNLNDKQTQSAEIDGVVVRAINTGSAYKAGIQTGDILLNLNSVVIHHIGDVDPILNAIAPGTTVAVLVQRKGNRFFLPLKLN